MQKPSTIEDYINHAPLDQRPDLMEIRRLIEKNLTKARGSIGASGFPIYTIGKQWKAGFAYRGQGPLLYIIEPELLNQHASKLKPIRSGKSCLHYCSAGGLSMGELRQLVAEMLKTINSKINENTV